MLNNRFLWIVACAMASVLVVCHRCPASEADEFYQGFRNPPSEVRPDVYWWWNGNTVNEKEIQRELDVLKEAGIGGVLIFPMAMTMGASLAGAKELEWLGLEWGKMVKAAVEEAKKRGLSVDLLVGTGWPFGGPFLKSGEQIQRVQVSRKEMSGPGTFKGNIRELMVLPGGAYGETDHRSEPRLMFLRLVPKDLKSLDPGIEMKDMVQGDGTVEFDIPPGNHVLYTGTWKEGFMAVNIPAPGGQGPVLDHFSGEATERYLDYFTRQLNPVMGGAFSGLRSLHVDSFEFTGANWTTDLPQEFEKRRGYSLEPYLPFALDESSPEGGDAFADAVWRVRYDLWRTLAELFEERFLKPFHKWSRKMGSGSRAQAYGCPSIDPLDIKMVVDHPMCETWISVARNIPKDETLIPVEKPAGPESFCLWSTMSNKYTSSAAHLTGTREVSCETMTNDLSAFRTTLEQVKMACDLNFITGVNHPVFHGYNYSPPEAGFPGWFYCGEYFDEKNSWWPYFRKLTDYTARLSWVFQKSEPKARVALIDPSHKLWETLHQNGYCADYVSESVLRAADFKGGKLRFGPQTYEILILNGVGTIEPESAQALKRFTEAGGKILFLGHAPHRSPGLKDADRKDREVQETIQEILRIDPGRIAVIPRPENGTSLRWIRDILVAFGVRPAVEIASPDPMLFPIRHRKGGREIFFFANLNFEKPVSFRARFATEDKTPWRWDAETGMRSAYPHSERKNMLEIRLKPMETLLLVFEPNLPGKANRPPVPDFASYVDIKSPWKVTLRPVEEKAFTRTLADLTDFSQDKELISFSGTAVYYTEFEATDKEYRFLSLGRVHDISEVKLNGKPLGVRWWGEHLYDVSGVLHSGSNVMEVKVTNTLSNYCRSLKDNPVTRIWVADKNRPPLPAGLIGPVRLMKGRSRLLRRNTAPSQ